MTKLSEIGIQSIKGYNKAKDFKHFLKGYEKDKEVLVPKNKLFEFLGIRKVGKVKE